MKSIKMFLFIFAAALLACVGATPGYSQKPVSLKYNYPSSGVKYLSKSKIIQSIDVNGQMMEANVFSAFGCTIKKTGSSKENMALEVKVDTMGQRTESPQGSTGGTIVEVAGKTFKITVTPAGKEIDISEAQKIKYNVEGSGESDLSETFYDFFPDLPATPVSPGYTWTKNDTINTKSPSYTIFMTIRSENKIEGSEIIDGVECIKITSILTGTRKMNFQAQGNVMALAGPFTGSSTVYFSPVEGYFIRQSVSSRLIGTLDITSPETMSFPLIQEANSVNTIIK